MLKSLHSLKLELQCFIRCYKMFALQDMFYFILICMYNKQVLYNVCNATKHVPGLCQWDQNDSRC